MTMIVSRVWVTLAAARAAQTLARTGETGPDQGSSGLDPARSSYLGFVRNPGILASAGGAGGHGSTPMVAVALTAVVACMAVAGRRPRRRRRAQRTAGLAGSLWLVVIVAAGVLGWLLVLVLVRVGAGVFG